MESEESVSSSETPMMRAGRAEAALATPEGKDRLAEHEADVAVADIDSYVAATDPAFLTTAEEELNAWEIPTDPLDGTLDQSAIGGNEELVGVFSAGTEMEANIVRGLLESEGIPVMTAINGTAFYGGILALGGGGWGSPGGGLRGAWGKDMDARTRAEEHR